MSPRPVGENVDYPMSLPRAAVTWFTASFDTCRSDDTFRVNCSCPSYFSSLSCTATPTKACLPL